MNLYLDIETIPSQDEDVIKRIAESVTPPGNISKPETITKWEAEKKPEAVEKAWRQTALDGTLCEIICIGWAFDDEEIKATARTLDEPEKNVLEDFFSDLLDATRQPGRPQRPLWVGHNVLDFDIRVLWQRCVINRFLPIPLPIFAKPYGGDAVVDTMRTWAGPRGTISQDKLARALGLPGKGDMDGSMVWDTVKSGNILKVMDYCKDDVAQVREIYRRMVTLTETIDER